MSQLNIHLTPSFEKDLHKFMRLRHIKTKSEAIRIAIKEGIKHSMAFSKVANFTSWLGVANEVPTNKKTKFTSDNDLWR